MIFLNRKNITMINELRRLWGLEKTAQTNSTLNGNFGVLRRYEFSEDKGKRKNFRGTVLEIRTERGLKTEYDNIMA